MADAGDEDAKPTTGKVDRPSSRPSLVHEVLSELGMSKTEIENAEQVLNFVQYLLDDDNNLTSAFNLNKAAKDQLVARIVEIYEGPLSEEDEIVD